MSKDTKQKKGNKMNIRKITATLVAAAIALTATGCSVKFGTNKQLADDAVVAHPTGAYEKDEALIVDYLTFKKEYAYWMRSNNITDDSNETYAAACEERRAYIINYLVNEKVLEAKAKELGVDTLNEEELAAVMDEYEASVEEQIEYFGENADYGTLESGEVISDEDKRERGEAEFDAYLADCLVTRDDLLMWQKSSAVMQKVKDEVTKNVTVERSEAETEFNTMVDGIEQLYNEDVEEYEIGAQYSSFWLPEGARYAKHILIKLDDKVVDEIMACRQNGDDAGADKLRDEKLAECEQEAVEIINMLDNGGDFDELIPAFSDDAEGSALYSDGYLCIPGSVSFVEGFIDGVMALENIGDYSLIYTDLGWHIIQYASDAVISQEDKDYYIDVIHNTLIEEAKDEAFSSLMEEWRKSYSYEIDYEALNISEEYYIDESSDATQAAE